MAIILDGTNGITTPSTASSGAVSGTTGTFSNTVNISGSVGIGTNTPVGKLSVVSATNGEVFRAQKGGGTNLTLLRVNMNDTDNTGTIEVTGAAGNPALVFATVGVERMRINANGTLMVGGTTTTSSRAVFFKDSPSAYNVSNLELFSAAGDVVLGFHASGSTAVCMDHVRGSTSLRVVNSGRTAFAPILASAFTVNSDYRLKENLEPLTDAATRLMRLPVHRFSFIPNSMSYQNGQMVDGFLAHEVEEVVPEAVTGIKDAVGETGEAIYQGIDQSKLVPLLTAALQEALTKISALESRITALEVNNVNS